MWFSLIFKYWILMIKKCMSKIQNMPILDKWKRCFIFILDNIYLLYLGFVRKFYKAGYYPVNVGM